jgi:Glycerophosphoryl diester phosphodiesterase family
MSLACAPRESESAVHFGYSSVQDMLGKPEFYSAHRGGSADDPEMTMEAYRNSAARGYGALEVSLAQSSDGVWFGLHDENLDRTSQVHGLPPASDMTWAEINRYKVTLNAHDGPQPYLAWSELSSAFGRTYVLFVDPKHASGHTEEFLNMVAQDAGVEHAVIKGYGGDTALADAARARGFQTWGYYYTADFKSGLLTDTQDHWSILGLNWDAPPEAWQQIRSFGKSVMAHVIASPQQRDTAKREGARGFQVSSPDHVSSN